MQDTPWQLLEGSWLARQEDWHKLQQLLTHNAYSLGKHIHEGIIYNN
jgi:hypothetical protein